MLIKSYANALLSDKEDILGILSDLTDELKIGWGEDIVSCLRGKIYDLNHEADHARDETLDEQVDLQLKVEKLQKQKRYWKNRYFKEKKTC